MKGEMPWYEKLYTVVMLLILIAVFIWVGCHIVYFVFNILTNWNTIRCTLLFALVFLPICGLIASADRK